MTKTVRRLLTPYVSICCALCFLTGAPAFTQQSIQPGDVNKNLVTLHLKNTSLRTVLQEIGRQGKLRITYPDALVERYTDIDVQVAHIAAESALAHVLSSTELTYIQTAPNQIAIVRKEVEKRDSTSRELGSVNGKVLDSATQKGVAGAIVTVVDIKRSTKTQSDGTFQIENLPAGRYTVAVKILGYQAKQVRVDVQSRKSNRTTILIQQSSTTLTEVVTTATGIQRSYQVGSDVTRIDVDEVRKFNDITSVADILATRVPGMFMQSGGGDAGAGNRIRIRGIHSLTLSNDPILIIDGVRVATIGQESMGNTSTLSSRLDDIDPATIATIEVFKGPSAATLYGPDAANGVIVITKKRGLVGETRWTISANTRLSAIPRKFPGEVIAWAKGMETNDAYPCEVNVSGMSGCNTIDSITTYSPLNDPYYSTMGRGRSSDLGISLQTGTRTVQTVLTVRATDELGATQLSKAGRERLRALKGAIPAWVGRPNGKQQLSGDVNFTMQSIPLFNVGIQANLMHLSLRNNGNGSLTSAAEDTTTWLPEQQMLRRNEESTDRYVAALMLNTRNWSWLVWGGTFGAQLGNTSRDIRLRAEDCLLADCSNALGTRTRATMSTTNYSINSHATVMKEFSSWVTLHSSVGLNFNRGTSEAFSVEGQNMPFGISDPSSAPVKNTQSGDSRTATAGVYLEERLAVAQRLFMSGAIRRDAGNSLGSASRDPLYPKFDISWIASDHPIPIPGIGVLNTVRLRLAHGQSGHQPTLSNLKATLTRGAAWYDGATHPIYLYNSLGNSQILPERTKELEFGVDMALQGRIEAVGVTYFRHMTEEAIVPYSTAAESGLPSLDRVENLGKMLNSGLELSTSLRLVDNSSVSWNLTASFSQTRNKVLSLGRFPQMGDQISGWMGQRVVVGYPAFGVWARPVLSYDDRNDDGFLQDNEMIIGDSLAYVGWSQPRYALRYRSSLALWRGIVRFSSSFSHDVGLAKQARIGDPGYSAGDLEGQILSKLSLRGLQTISALTWNSGDMTVQIPAQWLRYVRARSGTVSVSGSNLYQWTNWRGNDANVGNVGPDRANTSFATTPNTRNWALRMNVTY